MTSPFVAPTVQPLPVILQGFKLILRVEKINGVQVNVKKNGTPSATEADYFLVGGDSLVVSSPGTIVSVLSVIGSPKIYWTMETL